MKATLIYHKDYKPDSEVVIEGENEIDLFTDYTNMNDTLRYCNGSYYRWKDAEWNKKYHEFLDGYKGNFFLACAVERGALID